jgi:hypothetical protein
MKSNSNYLATEPCFNLKLRTPFHIARKSNPIAQSTSKSSLSKLNVPDHSSGHCRQDSARILRLTDH